MEFYAVVWQTRSYGSGHGRKYRAPAILACDERAESYFRWGSVSGKINGGSYEWGVVLKSTPQPKKEITLNKYM